ncbi:MAG: hypothetical protein ACRC0U_00965 [Vibrio sp.]
MPWIKVISVGGKWVVAIAVLFALVAYDQQVKSLRLELSSARWAIEAKEMQYQTAQSFNESLNATVQEMNRISADSHAAEEWSGKFNAAMAESLEKAKGDIGRLIDEAATSNSCSGSYSPAVYQRMLDFYRAGAEGDNSG